MGKLIKNHWARLVVLTAAIYHVAASLEGFFWPKFFWDWLTTNFDILVKPIPILQIINMVFAIVVLLYEWPLKFMTKFNTVHASIESRLLLLPTAAFWAVLMYQGTNPALYYMIATAIYFWAYCDGESVEPVPWNIPKPKNKSKREKV